MNMAVVTFPALDPGAAGWIESVRRTNDPQADRIGAHVTLVFPLRGDELNATCDHIEHVAASTVPFTVCFDRITVNIEHEAAFVFLVPGIGSRELTSMHERLHDGELRVLLQSDRTFLPHVTIARFGDPSSAHAFAERAAKTAPDVAGRVEEIELLDTDSLPVRRLGRYPLTGPSGSPTSASP